MVATQDLIPLSEARKTLIPRRPGGKPVNPATAWRWVRHGLEGVDGERIRLAVTYVGSRPYVTPDAVSEFFDAVTEAKLERHRRVVEPLADVSDDELADAGLI
jgi:hypothetical protein